MNLREHLLAERTRLTALCEAIDVLLEMPRDAHPKAEGSLGECKAGETSSTQLTTMIPSPPREERDET